MANDTNKPLSDYDQTQIIQKVFNPTESTLAVGSFIAGKLGHRIERDVISATIDEYSYFDNATLLYTIRVTYDGSDHNNVDAVERVV